MKLPVCPQSSDIPSPTTTQPHPTRRNATLAHAAMVIVAAGTAAGCARPAAPAGAASPLTQPPPAASRAARSPAAAPVSSSPLDGITQLATPSAYPNSDDAGRQDAQAAAAAAMQAFARHDLPTHLWWAGLAPLLSPTAVQAYQGVDPANVPAHQVTGVAYPTGDTGTPYLARAAVPTDAGDYVVLLSRTGQGQRWLVERLTPPPRR